MLRVIDGGLAATSVSGCSVREKRSLESHDEQLSHGLREHIERLRLVQSVVSLSVMALRRQDAERDEDIASVLDHHAANPLDEEISHVEALLARFDQSPAPHMASRARSRAS
jgi:microsomal dipeptidase-like Zn-dependent dipeptidase